MGIIVFFLIMGIAGFISPTVLTSSNTLWAGLEVKTSCPRCRDSGCRRCVFNLCGAFCLEGFGALGVLEGFLELRA